MTLAREPAVNKIAILSQTFTGLSPDELEAMARVTRAQTYPAGYYLCNEGAYEEIFYLSLIHI